MSWIARDMPDEDRHYDAPDASEVECPRCEGTDKDCALCYGTGWVSAADLADAANDGAPDSDYDL